MTQDIGDRFQSETKYSRGRLPGGFLDWAARPETYKSYPSGPKIHLPPILENDGPPLWKTIKNRRSVRNFAAQPLKKEDLSRLLWASQGITGIQGGFEFRAAPSAGALYPIETYCVIHAVEDISTGIYHYTVREHQLSQLALGDFRISTAKAALDQNIASTCSVLFIWTAVFPRSKWKYKQRAFRYVYLDAGHIAENLALAAVALELGSCQIAALYDDEANALLGIDGEEESVIYMTALGFPC